MTVQFEQPPAVERAPDRRPFMRSRAFIGILLIAALLLTTIVQNLVRQKREDVIYADGIRPRTVSRLAGIDTFALGLILGGLRGPLVMFLWSNVEKQKIDRNLEGVDTQIELIRMLQPEFDSVHLFQIWNKAYNLSVQMSSLPNKYATILDAVDYARSVDQERPDNVSILAALGDVYFNKLGDSSEKRYYSMRIRQETVPHKDMPRTQRGQQGWRRTQHDVVLDEQGFILPEYLKPKMDLKGYTGAEYQYLQRYNTPEMGGFPHGLPPIAIGYNYYRRAAVLIEVAGLKHLQLTEAVIDSRGAIILKKWAEHEWEYGRRAEVQALGLKEVDEREQLEPLTASLPLNTRFAADAARAKEWAERALFAYRRTTSVTQHAIEEYRRHIDRFGGTAALTYASHIANAEAVGTMAQADHDYLAVMAANAGVVPSKQTAALTASARRHYRQALEQFYRLQFRHFTEPEAVAAVFPEVTRKLLGTALKREEFSPVDPELCQALRRGIRSFYTTREMYDPSHWDVQEFDAYIARAEERLRVLASR